MGYTKEWRADRPIRCCQYVRIDLCRSEMVELERLYPSDSLPYTQQFTTGYEDEECDGNDSADITPYQEAFLVDLKSRDEGKRGRALNCMASSLEQWARASDDAVAHKKLRSFLPIAVRLTLDSPFADVRERLKRILEQLKVSERLYLVI